VLTHGKSCERVHCIAFVWSRRSSVKLRIFRVEGSKHSRSRDLSKGCEEIVQHVAILGLPVISMLIISLLMTTDTVKPFGFILHEVARMIRSRIEARAGVHGLSEAQLRLLIRLWKEEGATQARLAQALEVEPISISRLLDRMEQGGWIERRQDPNDRRVRTIFTTAKTRQIHSAVKDVASQVYEEALVGVAPETRDALFEGLQAMARNLSSDAAFAAPCFNDQPQSGAASSGRV